MSLKIKPLVFGTQRYQSIARQMTQNGKWVTGKTVIETFPDGERYQRIDSKIQGEAVVLVGGTASDADTLELYDLACALVKYSAKKLDLVIPYYGYSTMERAVQWGEVVTAKTRARLLSSIPMAPRGTRVFFLDLHSEGIPHYFEGNITPIHVYGKPFVVEVARKLGGKKFVLASTDAGRAKWVQSLANDLGVQPSFVFKKRTDGRKTTITAVSAHVEGEHVIIYDDMIRTGGSLMKAAQAYLNAGAKKIDVITTHGIFPEDAVQKIQASGLIQSIHCTDSHPNASQIKNDFLKVHPVAPLFVEAIKKGL